MAYDPEEDATLSDEWVDDDAEDDEDDEEEEVDFSGESDPGE